MIQDRLKRFALRFLPDRLLVGLKKIHYIRALRSATEDREPDLQIVRHLVRPGAVAVDIGANFGIYTAALSNLVGPAGKVLSIEPVPQTYELLAANVGKLGLSNVEGFNLAVSAEDGSAWMEVPLFNSGGENYYEARVVEPSPGSELRAVEVPARCLDSLLESYPEVDFIKCDVEGHERDCLSGASRLLDRCRPAWLIEVSGNPDSRASNASEVFRLLGSHGYRAYWFDGREVRPRQRGERSVNYFFLQPHHVARIPTEYFGEPREHRRAA
jgi:FkbM family methyltransferase